MKAAVKCLRLMFILSGTQITDTEKNISEAEQPIYSGMVYDFLIHSLLSGKQLYSPYPVQRTGAVFLISPLIIFRENSCI